MACEFKICFIKVSIKKSPSSEPYFVQTSDIDSKVFVDLWDDNDEGDEPHTRGFFTLTDLVQDTRLKVEVIFKNFKWEDLGVIPSVLEPVVW